VIAATIFQSVSWVKMHHYVIGLQKESCFFAGKKICSARGKYACRFTKEPIPSSSHYLV
jgi:hypothetical protein